MAVTEDRRRVSVRLVTLQAFMVVVFAALAFAFWFRNTPAQHPAVNPAELKLIREGNVVSHRLDDPDLDPTAPPKDPDRMDEASFFAVLISMAFSLSMWALCIQAFFRAFGYALFITWFPAYLEQGFGVATSRAVRRSRRRSTTSGVRASRPRGRCGGRRQSLSLASSLVRSATRRCMSRSPSAGVPGVRQRK